jgi:hypothetical protein
VGVDAETALNGCGVGANTGLAMVMPEQFKNLDDVAQANGASFRRKGMALVARKVLADCETAHQLLRKEKMGSATWRVHWVACLTLLRAVGHILDKIDGEADAKHSAAIKAKWEEWNTYKQENSIFWNFIDSERNNLLKEYKFGVAPSQCTVMVHLTSLLWLPSRPTLKHLHNASAPARLAAAPRWVRCSRASPHTFSSASMRPMMHVSASIIHVQLCVTQRNTAVPAAPAVNGIGSVV